MTRSTPDDAKKSFVLAAVCLAGLMMPLSFTGPAVAMPAIRHDLGGTPVALGWVVNAFILSFGSGVMAAGALADQFGRKRIFRTGVALFAAFSAIIGLAPSVVLLDFLRAAQGGAAALAMSAGAAALAQEFEGPARTRAFSLLGTTFGVGLAFGPIWSGFLIETFGWRSIFFTGTLIGLLVLFFGVPRLRETRDPGAVGIDGWGTASFTATLLLLTFGIVQGPESGWGSPLVVGLLVGAAVLMAAFVMIERRVRRPMLDLSLFRYSRFIGVQLLPIATAFSFVVLLIFLPVRFIGVEGYGEIQAGLMMLPLCAPMAIVPFLASIFARWIPAGVLSGLGLILSALGILWLSTVPPHAGAVALGFPMVTIGTGAGLPWGLMDDLSVSVVPKERAGMATGIFATMRVAGEAIALVIVRAVLAALVQSGLRPALAGEGARVAAEIPRIANEIAGGNIDGAVASLPNVGRAVLVDVYGHAFQTTLYVLAVITSTAAIGSFAVLRRPRHTTAAGRLDLECV